MYRFWESIIKPCFEIAGVKTVVEIGAQNGYQTEKLIAYAREHDGMAISIDPFPLFDYRKLEKDYEPCFKLYEEMSIPALPKIKGYDAILIDGDHNWYTVYTELNLVLKGCEKFPLVFLHDVAWPYARRDLYYNPDNIPEEHRLPYKRKGLIYGQAELAETGGINENLCNAIDEGTPHNGILTAVEDFIAEHPEFVFHMIDCISGLGFICPKDGAGAFIEYMESPEALKKLIKITEEQRLKEFIGRNTMRLARNELIQRKKALEGDVKQLGFTVGSLRRDIERQMEENKALQRQLDGARQFADDLENSFRFRAGSLMYDAKSSPVKLVKLPVSMARLMREYRGGGGGAVKPRYAAPKQPEKYIKPYTHGRAELLDYASSRLLSREKPVDGNALVSIVIISRNGMKNLTVLFESLKNTSFYGSFEIVYVDNASTDESVSYIESMRQYFTINIIRNKENLSFSAANNIGAQNAKGEYLLFLNNDIEVTDNWLDEMLLAAQSEKCGAVGAKLIYPLIPGDSINKGKSYLVQHKGICFADSEFDGEFFLRPYNIGNCDDPIEVRDKDIRECSVVTAACLLVAKSRFDEVGGFDERYVYGYEDVDLCLKLFRRGYRNYCASTAMLFHYEFGTQASDCESDNAAIIKRRSNNIRIFKSKWQSYLVSELLRDKLVGAGLFSETSLTVALAVTESCPNTTAGDFFTAMELGEALKKRGINVKYLDRNGNGDWYDVGGGTDVLISLLDAYDVTKVHNSSPRLITIAWARNWFERWCEKPYIKEYGMIFASSPTACAYMERTIGKSVELFPIATNCARFTDIQSGAGDAEKYSSDYVFTGSYWNDPREILDILNPAATPYKFKVFGANWEKTEKFRDYTGGFVTYAEMPRVYKHTKIVIDDANRVTKPFGAVNSRVFDALAAGRLVLTNGRLGAEETFAGMLPSFENTEELEKLLNTYMTDSAAYDAKVAELKEFVLANHTYDARAERLCEILRGACEKSNRKIAIMTPVPKWEERNSWGDYHFAIAMKKCFDKRGFIAEIRILPEWELPFDGKYVIVLRGISEYHPRAEHFNIMWNISHPDDITMSEYNAYDAVFISSEKQTEKIRQQAHTHVETLMQCTDTEVFRPDSGGVSAGEILFVGNSRKVFRQIIKDLIPTEYDLSIYGSNWDGFVDKKYIKGKSIDNAELYKYYSSCDILLNDHWTDMRDKGFVSNRLFDGAAAGAFIISDYMPEIDEIFGGCIVTYKDKQELHDKIKFYMDNPNERRKISEAGRALVESKHTFENRMDRVIEFIGNDK